MDDDEYNDAKQQKEETVEDDQIERFTLNGKKIELLLLNEDIGAIARAGFDWFAFEDAIFRELNKHGCDHSPTSQERIFEIANQMGMPEQVFSLLKRKVIGTYQDGVFRTCLCVAGSMMDYTAEDIAWELDRS